nr:hypothetical protein [uncultured Comamonas sp.]
MTQAQSYEAWRITYQSDEQAARSAFDTAEMLRQELLVARAAITSLERDVSQALTERDDATDFIDKILDEVLGQDRHEWTSAYDWDDALADVEVKMAALKSGKCLHQIAEPAAQGLDAQDASRWREAIKKVGAENQLGAARYVIRGLEAPRNVMRGCVAGHFTKSIDAAIAAQAKQGGA